MVKNASSSVEMKVNLPEFTRSILNYDDLSKLGTLGIILLTASAYYFPSSQIQNQIKQYLQGQT